MRALKLIATKAINVHELGVYIILCRILIQSWIAVMLHIIDGECIIADSV